MIWRGWGFLVAVFVVAAVAGMEVLATALEGEGAYQQDTASWAGAGFLLAGVATFAVGRRLSRRPARVLYDRETGEEVQLRPRHDFFFVRMEHWGIAFVVGGFVALLIGALT